MARNVFTWFPDVGSQESCEPTVAVTKFGDGYETRMAKGINSLPGKWTMTFSRGATEGNAIRNFLRAQGSVLAFDWTNPFNELGAYVCRKWTLTRDHGMVNITCDFEQVFEA